MSPKKLLTLINEEISSRDQKSLPALYLTEPYAKWVIDRRKTAIVTKNEATKYIGKKLYLCGKHVYGIIILNPSSSMRVNIGQFKKQITRHFISDAERVKLWKDTEYFYLHSVRVLKVFKQPRKYYRKEDKLFLESIDIERIKPYFTKFNVPDLCHNKYITVTKLLQSIYNSNLNYYVEPELAGHRIIIHKRGNRLQLRDTNGKNITIDKLKLMLDKKLNFDTSFILDSTLLESGILVITDIIANNANNLYLQPLLNRNLVINKLAVDNNPNIFIINRKIVSNKNQLLGAIKYFNNLGYYNLLIRQAQGLYPLTNITSDWHRLHIGVKND